MLLILAINLLIPVILADDDVIQSPSNRLISYRLDDTDKVAIGKSSRQNSQGFRYQGAQVDSTSDSDDKPIKNPFLDDPDTTSTNIRSSKKIYVDDSDDTDNGEISNQYTKVYDPSTGTYKYYYKPYTQTSSRTITYVPSQTYYYPSTYSQYPYYSSYRPSYGYSGCCSSSGYGGNLFSIGSGFNVGGFGIGSGLGISLG